MVLASNATAPATCGHVQTGSSRVTVQGMGVCRVGVDSAGGVIAGPGNPRVTVEGAPISVVGDLVAGHGDSPHSSATTTATQARLNIG